MVDGVEVVGDFPRPIGRDTIVDVGPLHCLFHCEVDGEGRKADHADFERAAQAVLEEGLIDKAELERAQAMLLGTSGNRHIGELLLSQDSTHLTVKRWLNALELVRAKEGQGVHGAGGRAGWRSMLGAASGWFQRKRPGG